MTPSREPTRRECEVIENLRDGTSQKVVAHRLGMAYGTLKMHLSNVSFKFHVSGLKSLIAAYDSWRAGQ